MFVRVRNKSRRHQVFKFRAVIIIIRQKMQAPEDLEPIVRIRELAKDKVNFVLENVDLA